MISPKVKIINKQVSSGENGIYSKPKWIIFGISHI